MTRTLRRVVILSSVAAGIGAILYAGYARSHPAGYAAAPAPSAPLFWAATLSGLVMMGLAAGYDCWLKFVKGISLKSGATASYLLYLAGEDQMILPVAYGMFSCFVIGPHAFWLVTLCWGIFGGHLFFSIRGLRETVVA